MKKIRKADLKLLADTMQIISKREQSRYVGGAFYYSEEGAFLGKLGSNDEIRIVNDATFDSLNSTYKCNFKIK
ncbi:MAG: hypothetical protein Q4F97_12650 [Bacteroidales bacterium]|nr:hypothetical protein [Bacteroidales bacterium]